MGDYTEMGTLQIVIPTYRRMPRQATLSYLPDKWMERVTLVVDEEDAKLESLYKSDLRGATIMVHPPEINTIAKKRAWIIMNPAFGKIVMFDDDLRFAVRRADTGHSKLYQAEHHDLNNRLYELDGMLEEHIHAGWSARQGNNNQKENCVYNGRMMFVLGYRCDLLRGLVDQGAIKLGRVRTREDMELTVQLLRLGMPNWIDYTIAADQVGGYAAKGGCSDERSVESSNEDAEVFAALHPGLVKVVEKTYKGSLNRKEVVVQWKKAFNGSRI